MPTFGISDINAVNISKLFIIKDVISNIDEIFADTEQLFLEIISFFREFRPKDPAEAMMISKLILIDSISTREFVSANSSDYVDQKTMHQSRRIKLLRLWHEIKDRLDKHRKTEQKIVVQHNHIHNEGQAIIGSHLTAGRGS